MKKIALEPVAFPIQPRQIKTSSSPFLIFVWVSTLFVSSLPVILSQELHVLPAISSLWMRIVLLIGFIVLTYYWQVVRLLRAYFTIFLMLYVADAFFNLLGDTSVWQGWFEGVPTFSRDMLSSQLLRLGAAVAIILVTWSLLRNRMKFFLAVGNLNAAAEPVRWLGMERPLRWSRFGLILSVCITLGTLAFLILFSQPTGSHFLDIIPLLPVVILAAVMNAFSEEVLFRAVLLGPLAVVVGKSQALLLTAVLFGLWHFYGVPYGVIGVIMSGILGWLLGKSMIETRGMFWAWFIHFWQDVAIFTFIALGSIVPGG
jgi:membrane protease YdiL (CAAX protease family)